MPQVPVWARADGSLRTMNRSVRALRGATTLERDDEEHLIDRVRDLLEAMLERNDIEPHDVVSILFTATPDVHSAFPAVAARNMGMGDVPLICAQELDIVGAMPLCIRTMMHVETDRQRSQMRHVYLHDARSLRDDLPG